MFSATPTRAGLFLAPFLLLTAARSWGQEPNAPTIPPGELVRETVSREVAAANATDVKHIFRSLRQTPKGSQTRLYVETNEAMARAPSARAIASMWPSSRGNSGCCSHVPAAPDGRPLVKRM